MKKYHTIGLGGTFDHFHIGHQHFLEFAASFADHLVIGLTTTELTQHKEFPESIQTFTERKNALEEFLHSLAVSFDIFELRDQFGKAIEQNFMEALAVTEMTKSGGEAVNQKRSELGYPQLPVHVCQMKQDENGEIISSTRIRQGSIDRNGRSFLNILLKTDLLSAEQKVKFKTKQGKVISKPSTDTNLRFVVGDIVLETFIQNGWPYSLGIFDQRNLRSPYASQYLDNIQPTVKIANPAGQISPELSRTLFPLLSTSDLNETRHILIDGEEDLAAVAVTLLAPLGAAVYYGQPQEGVVEVIITEDIKKKFVTILQNQ